MSSEEQILFLFLVCLLDNAKSKRTKARNDGGPLEQPKHVISTDSPATPTAVQVPNLISPTPQPQVLALNGSVISGCMLYMVPSLYCS